MARILLGNIRGPQGPKGDTGPQGPQGPKGATGPMPTLINNLTTNQAGQGALDAAQGKALADDIGELNASLLDRLPRYRVDGCNTFMQEGIFKTILEASYNGKRFQLIFCFEEKELQASYYDGSLWNQKTIVSWSDK